MRQNHNECQPISMHILQVLLDAVPSHHASKLSLSITIWVADIIGTFTSSHVSEYAQSQVPSGCCFKEVPRNAAISLDGGNPIVFMRPDFSFYSSEHLEVIVDLRLVAYL